MAATFDLRAYVKELILAVKLGIGLFSLYYEYTVKEMVPNFDKPIMQIIVLYFKIRNYNCIRQLPLNFIRHYKIPISQYF